MPIIAIVLRDHPPDVLPGQPAAYLAHVHAEYQGQVAVFSILDGALPDGGIPPAKQKLVVAWMEIHKDELLADWNLAVIGEKVFRIRGLE